MRAFFRSWVAVGLAWGLLVGLALVGGFESLAVAYAVLGVALLVAEWIEVRRTGRTISENTGRVLDRHPTRLWLLVVAWAVGFGILIAHFWAY